MIRPLATDAGDANEVNGQNEKPFATADDAADDANDEEEKEERSSDGSVKNPPIAILTVHTGLHSGLHTSLVKSIWKKYLKKKNNIYIYTTCTSPATLLCLDWKYETKASVYQIVQIQVWTFLIYILSVGVEIWSQIYCKENLDHKLASRAFEVFLRSVTKPKHFDEEMYRGENSDDGGQMIFGEQRSPWTGLSIIPFFSFSFECDAHILENANSRNYVNYLNLMERRTGKERN